jgi:putative signal transducing protein
MNDEIVVVRTFNDRIEADLAASALDAAGIESMIRDDDAGGMQPALALTNGVQLLVHADDASAAGDILDGASRDVPSGEAE